MKTCVSIAEMREIDRATLEKTGIPEASLMEAAGLAVAGAARQLCPDGPIAILCGQGNNGGDGLVAARHLLSIGIPCEIYISGAAMGLKSEFKRQYDILRSCGGRVRHLKNRQEIEKVTRHHGLIIDALLGTGFNRNIEGLMADIITWINRQSAPVLAVDTPSGVDADSGAVRGPAVRAHTTVTLGALKTGMLFSPAREHCGNILVERIGFPESILNSDRRRIVQSGTGDIRGFLRPLRKDDHKGRRGKVLSIAGSRGMAGAAMLCAQAALRAGAGLVVAALPGSIEAALRIKPFEVMTHPAEDGSAGHFVPDSLHGLKDRLMWADAVALGPGLGRDPGTGIFVRALLQACDKPMVIDADALFHLSPVKKSVRFPNSPVLTPHRGEFDRLFPGHEDLHGQPLAEALMALAHRHRCTIHLKGAPSMTSSPTRRVTINGTGNAGLATGGSGDVLTGITATFLAQGLSPADAMVCAALCHGAAADIVANRRGMRGMKAGDVVEALPAVFRSEANA